MLQLVQLENLHQLKSYMGSDGNEKSHSTQKAALNIKANGKFGTTQREGTSLEKELKHGIPNMRGFY